ncbi:hypothetical protein MTR_7g014710 [Medicago truncatula]|uniref:Uncharacterized protein n=1 Tax=Medicago truncatula TaxID=3880 RepID=G7L688_MEDTR|nr:hypothetical protein MTR_7g014710 [Medicago truncatula]
MKRSLSSGTNEDRKMKKVKEEESDENSEKIDGVCEKNHGLLNLVGVWLPGENGFTARCIVKCNFKVFGYPPTLYRHRKFAFSESICTEAAFPSFLESSFPTVKKFQAEE